ncbi:MAG: polyribonucleotide nucleotidyltransferase [Anaerolineae bacterium]|nr:polyribonucleotide nucleotidyltransferase [Anaerolineae bacterium]
MGWKRQPARIALYNRSLGCGRIPGSFFRREGRPSEKAILIARVTDRPLRPLFDESLRHEVQIIITALSHDQEHEVDVEAIIGSSAALMISDVPWNGPVGAVRVGLIEGKLRVNPTIPEMEDSLLDLRVAGTRDAIIMVECGAHEVSERYARRGAGPRAPGDPTAHRPAMGDARSGGQREVHPAGRGGQRGTARRQCARVTDPIREIVVNNTDRHKLNEAVDALREAVLAEYAEDETASPKEIRETILDVLKKAVRDRILNEGIRPDGRDYTTIRPLSAEVGISPRAHGSGLFQRGETQVLTIATLGTPREAQSLDGLSPEDTKRYLHHYNFPPYSTGETWMVRGPRRREIGHGALAEAALAPMIPDEEEFPYTIRLVSEVLSSNGSTSMASVCGSTLALMDTGVPIKAPVGGIAMGLIKEGDKYAVLTDIQGMEDHLGDMDFKVAGTAEGITALQMDLKVGGISTALMRQALEQARQARLQIIDVIRACIPEPREELSPFAPRMTVIHIDPEKIGMIIGPGGKTIRGIQDETGAKIDIQDDGTVFVAAVDGPAAEAAIERIMGLTEEPEVGRVYTGKVVRIEPYGAFVEFLPGHDGMVHISQLADYRVNKVEDEVSLGDEIMVMVTDVDPVSRKVRLSRQAVLEGWTVEEARERDRGVKSGGGRPGGGRPSGGRGSP